jgi:hypothetical protein
MCAASTQAISDRKTGSGFNTVIKNHKTRSKTVAEAMVPKIITTHNSILSEDA